MYIATPFLVGAALATSATAEFQIFENLMNEGIFHFDKRQIVGTGIIILRSSNPDLHRPFKVPFSPVVPILTVLVAAFLMNNLPLDTWLRLIVWMSIGLVVYFAAGAGGGC